MASTKDRTNAKQIAKKINRLCKPLVAERGWRGAAEQVELPTMTLKNATTGSHVPSAKVIIAIATYFNVSSDELLGLN